METTTRPAQESRGLDTTIKVLTVLKLLVQLAFYGLLLGTTIWFLINNPIPELIEDAQAKMIDGGFGS